MSINVQTVTASLKKIPLSTWLFGFLALLIYQAMEAGVTEFLEKLFRSSQGTPNWVWLIAGFSILLNLVVPLGIQYWLLSALKTHRNWSGDFQQLLIEITRLWGKIFLYCFAFLIPGIWKWMSSTFVPYVVLFSKKYQDGNADAIEQSKILFKKVWFTTLVVLLVFSMLIPFILTSEFDAYTQIWETPLGAILVGLGTYISMILNLYILFFIFNRASREVNHELVF